MNPNLPNRMERVKAITVLFSWKKRTKSSSQKYCHAPHRKLRFLRSLARKPFNAKILFSSFTPRQLQFLPGQRTGRSWCSMAVNCMPSQPYFAPGMERLSELLFVRPSGASGCGQKERRARLWWSFEPACVIATAGPQGGAQKNIPTTKNQILIIKQNRLSLRSRSLKQTTYSEKLRETPCEALPTL